MASRNRKKRKVKKTPKEELEEAVQECYELLKEPKKPRKPVCYEFYRDPTGNRKTVTPYRPTPPRSYSQSSRKTGKTHLPVDAAAGYIDPPTEPSGYESTEVEDALGKCQELLLDDEPPKQTWEDRMTSLSENWSSCRQELFEAMVTHEGMLGATCQLCQTENCVVRCTECHGMLCGPCDEFHHKDLPFHDRDAFVDGHFKPIPPTSAVDCDGCLKQIPKLVSFGGVQCCPSCKAELLTVSAAPEVLIVVTPEGRFDLNATRVQCNSCAAILPPCTLGDIVKAGYWPGSPTDTTYVFDQRVFQLWDCLQKRMPGTSESAFIRALEDVSSFRGRASKINSTTFGRSFKEWKFCQYELSLLCHQNWMKCPSCSISQHSCHVDGNMKLYRYKSSGIQKRPSYYKDSFIAEKANVDEHMRQIYSKQSKGKEDDNRCGDSHWRAANNRIKKRARLDETGLEIAGCRHGLAQWAVIWGGRWQEGSAWSTGEEVEQINSHLSRCGNTTKYMLPENRDELLTEHALAWNRRKVIMMVDSLCKRYSRAMQMCKTSETSFKETTLKLGLSEIEVDYEAWKAIVVQHAQEVELLPKGSSSRDRLQDQMEMLYYSVVQTSATVNKLAASSKQRSQLRKRIANDKARLESLVVTFNSANEEGRRPAVTMTDIMNGNFPWDNEMMDTPVRVKRMAVESYEMVKRWREEAVLVKQEMANFIEFYLKLTREMSAKITELEEKLKCFSGMQNEDGNRAELEEVKRYVATSDTKKLCAGKIGLLNKGLAFSKYQVRHAATSFKRVTNCDSWNVELDEEGESSDRDDDEEDDDDDDDEPLEEESNDVLDEETSIRSRLMESGVCVWEFPDHVSQSTLDGRNGSNACSVIALSFAQGLHDRRLTLSEASCLPPTWFRLMCDSIRLGNEFYDRSRNSLPHRFLSPAEAAVVAGSSFEGSVSVPFPVRVFDEHEPSTLGHQSRSLCYGNQGRLAVFVADDKTVLFGSLHEEALFLVDSHCHYGYGAAIVIGKSRQIDEFVSVCQSIMSLDHSTYGNFCFVSF